MSFHFSGDIFFQLSYLRKSSLILQGWLHTCNSYSLKQPAIWHTLVSLDCLNPCSVPFVLCDLWIEQEIYGLSAQARIYKQHKPCGLRITYTCTVIINISDMYHNFINSYINGYFVIIYKIVIDWKYKLTNIMGTLNDATNVHHKTKNQHLSTHTNNQ